MSHPIFGSGALKLLRVAPLGANQQRLGTTMTMSLKAAGLGMLLTLGLSSVATASPGYVTGDVNLRAGPSTDYPVVVTLPAGDDVEIFGCLSGYSWCDIDWNGYRGWVSSLYLESFYENRRVEIIYAAPPIISFSFDNYWDTYYTGRPFYRYRDRYYDDYYDRRDRRRDRREARRDRREERRELVQERRRDVRREVRQDRRRERRQEVRQERRQENRQERRRLRRQDARQERRREVRQERRQGRRQEARQERRQGRRQEVRQERRREARQDRRQDRRANRREGRQGRNCPPGAAC
jgi:uncharacterized protein YraI